MESVRIRVAVADDHSMIRMGIELSMNAFPTLQLVGSASHSTELVQLLDTQPCDVLVTDYAMPGGNYGDGLELLGFLRHRYPELAIVVMTGMDRSATVQAMLALGIENILSKADDTSHVPAAVQAAHVRRRYLSPTIAALIPMGKPRAKAKLSPREREVLALYVSGITISEIAERLQRRKQTISTQKASGMAKLGIEKDADLFKHAAELGLLPSSGKV
ncbi:response regulator transcription factor [Dyella sp.]|uniref:response regulator transcription factor n=1 Tax=Dyella sp. TaxID=1869338 RepID=UPI002D7957B2|nr:response regulator transcription factor [Dyella sp.]HET7331787.1 response regulator transcription factor [Dyella sp.]